MKNKVLPLLCLILTLSILACGCGKMIENEKKNAQTSKLTIYNIDPDKVNTITLNMMIDGDVKHSVSTMAADGGSFGENHVSFEVIKDDFSKGEDLDKFSICLKITETDGTIYTTEAVAFPLEIGEDYDFRIEFDDEQYFLWEK